MKSQQTRRNILDQLIQFGRPVKELSRALEPFGLDPEHEEDIALLNYKDIARIIGRYLNGELEVSDIHEWAGELELRDDIQFGFNGQHVFHVIFKLATPELEGTLTPQRAKRLFEVLSMPNPTEPEIDKAYE